MKSHVLDNPVWHSLNTRQSGFSLGGELAKRYPADVAPFAAISRPEQPAFAELASLVKDGEEVYLIGVEPPLPSMLKAEVRGAIIQMVCQRPVEMVDGSDDVSVLTGRDAPDMLALTSLTFPGYFRPRTYQMGTYLGVRVEGQLVAMAGERMFLNGYREVSAICTHPDHRGRGYARRLSSLITNAIFEQGVTPFLHVGHDNESAKSLYEKLGFVERRHLPILAISRA
jgi:ribosomal protein S18 acetylase RimI-like enzyme